MNQHSDAYNDLMAKADAAFDERERIIDRALVCKEHDRITDDEYYRLMGEADGLQQVYIDLRDQAILADRIFWSRYMAEVQAQADDRRYQLMEEQELRRG